MKPCFRAYISLYYGLGGSWWIKLHLSTRDPALLPKGQCTGCYQSSCIRPMGTKLGHGQHLFLADKATYTLVQVF